MTKKQLGHMRAIGESMVKKLDAKYRKGQKEHGGNIWEKAGMLANAEDEVTDLAVYVHTLRGQLEEAVSLMRAGTPVAMSKARDIIKKIIGRTND